MNILIVDENEVLRRQLFWAIRKNNELHEAATRSEAETLLATTAPDVVLLELLEQGDKDETGGLEFLARLQRLPSPPLTLIITRSDRKEIAARALKMGAFDYLTKPIDLSELPVILRRAGRVRELEVGTAEIAAAPSERKPPAAAAGPGTPAVIGVDKRVKQILEQLRRIAPTPVSVLITGETGTGKEIFANAVHSLSERAGNRLVALNCAVLSDTLVEDELFGHEKGAFTGAVERRKGRFELANGGSLFLDEIGDLSLALQSKFLRVLQEKQFERLGGSQPMNTDFRLICATHRNLPQMAREGTFREDLMFRLNVVSFHIPPLRERRGDIKLLAHHFLEEYARAFGRAGGLTFSREVHRFLYDYPWPGNVRELKHFVERAVALGEGRVIGLEALPDQALSTPEGPRLAEEAGSYETMVKKYKRQLVMEALEMAGHNKIQTAQMLGISKSYLFKLIKQLAIPG